jgi:hypothetical protein
MNVAGALNVHQDNVTSTTGLLIRCCFIISIYALPRLSPYFCPPFVFAFSEHLLLYKLASLSFLFLFPNLIFFNAILIPCSLHRPFYTSKIEKGNLPPPPAKFWNNIKNYLLCQK